MRILIIEDEEKIAQLVARALRLEGHAVDVELDSTAGYAMAHTEPYDCLVVDRMLPGDYRDGVELIRALRAMNVTTPALLLTALGEVRDKTYGLDSGADDYLTKPFSIDELLARVRALLRRPTPQQSTILRVGDIALDTTQRSVSFQGDEITLTAKELALLEYLMRSAGRVVSKDQIISHVWDFDADILPNTVEVYMKYLRTKIDQKYHVKYFHTVRGLGYKMSAD